MTPAISSDAKIANKAAAKAERSEILFAVGVRTLPGTSRALMQARVPSACNAPANIVIVVTDRVAAILAKRVRGLMGFAGSRGRRRHYRAFLTGSFMQQLNFSRSQDRRLEASILS